MPIIVLSQLSRAPETRSDHRPQLSDLRESGALEQDADLVVLIFRDDVYNKDPNNPDAGTAELILAKQRNGPTGVVKLAFLHEQTRFANLAPGAGGVADAGADDPQHGRARRPGGAAAQLSHAIERSCGRTRDGGAAGRSSPW